MGINSMVACGLLCRFENFACQCPVELYVSSYSFAFAEVKVIDEGVDIGVCDAEFAHGGGESERCPERA